MDEFFQALNPCGVEDERRIDYTEVTYQWPGLGPDLLVWHKEAILAVMVPVMLRSGKAETEDEATRLVNAHQKVDRMSMAGVVLPISMSTLVARKKV